MTVKGLLVSLLHHGSLTVLLVCVNCVEYTLQLQEEDIIVEPVEWLVTMATWLLWATWLLRVTCIILCQVGTSLDGIMVHQC